MINITDSAKEKMIELLDDEKMTILRFGLQGGGCSGFQYFFAMVEETEEDDVEFPLNETTKLVVDAASLTYLHGSEIDYKKDLMGEAFVFNNPNATGKCGCGSSMSF